MPGIIDLPKFKCGDFELLQVDKIHLEFIGNASRYIHSVTTPTPLLYYLFHKFSVRMMIKFGIRKEKENSQGIWRRTGRNSTVLGTITK